MGFKEDFFGAIEQGDELHARELLETHNFNPNLREGVMSGSNAVGLAARTGMDDLLKELIRRGGSVNFNDGTLTPIHMARKASTAEILISAGADVNQPWRKDAIDLDLPKGTTALHAASKFGQSDLLKVLLDAGADANVRDADGMTPLHRGAANRDAVDLLLAAGADPSVTSKNGVSAQELIENYAASKRDAPAPRERLEPTFRSAAPEPVELAAPAPSTNSAPTLENSIERGVDREFIQSLESRMAAAELAELGWRGRDDLDDIMADLEILAGEDWAKAAELWDKYLPNDQDKPIFIDGDDKDPQDEREQAQERRTAVTPDTNAPKTRSTSAQDREYDEPVADRPASSKKKEFVTPDVLRKRFIEADNKFYYREEKDKVAFEVKGRRLATKHDDPEVARSMVELAESKNWTSIKVKGTDDFKREVWLEASLRGMQVDGYKPKDVDIAKLEELRGEREEKGLNTIEKGRDIEREPAASRSSASREPASDKSAVVDENRQTLTDKQRTAIDTLKTILRERGDSETAIQMAADVAAERFHNNRVYVGKILDYGNAPYENDKKNENSFYVTLKTPEGEKQVWGVDLERAITDGKANKGDQVAIAYQGREAVTVPVKERDAKGELTGKTVEIVTNRNTWDVSRLDRLQEVARERLTEAAAKTDKQQPLVKVYDRDAQRTSERDVVIPENGRERDRSRG